MRKALEEENKRALQVGGAYAQAQGEKGHRVTEECMARVTASGEKGGNGAGDVSKH